MKHLYYIITLLLAQNIAQAQNSIQGRVYDKDTKESLFAGTVFIPDLKVGTTTDTSGAFVLNNIAPGKYLLQIKLLGYASTAITVTVPLSKPLEIAMAQQAGELDEVIVTGVSKATEIRRSPVPIVAIDHDYLMTNLATNAIDAITKVPGVTAVTTGPNVSKPFIRGLGYNRILTLYDGNRQEGQQWGDEHGIEVDQYSIERVEVIKGPASLTYGSDALAGVVNLIPTQPAPEGKLLGDITANYGTNNGEIGTSGMLEGTKSGIDWIARVSHKQAIDYQDKYDGRVFGTAFSETDASASVGIHRKYGFSHIGFSLYDDLQEIPDGSRDSATRQFTRQISEADTVRQIVSPADLKSYKIEPIHQHVQYYRVYTNNTFLLGKGGSIEANLGYQYSVRREFSHPVLTNVPGLYLQLNTFNYDLKYHMPEVKGWNLTAGVNGMYQTNKVTNGTEFVIPSYTQFDIGPFATVKRTFGKLDMEGGVRYDFRLFDNQALYTRPNPTTGFDMPVSSADTAGTRIFPNLHSLFQGLSASLGFAYNITKQLSVKLNLARGFRAPNIAEISANGVHPGTNIYQIGNSNFKPEFSLQPDFGISFSSKYVAFSVEVFYNYLQNYIYNQKLLGANGQDSVIVAGNQTFQFQSARAQLYGGELSLDIHPVKSLHFENGLSIVYADFLGEKGHAVPDSQRYLPFIPPIHGTSEVRYDFNVKQAHIMKAFVKIGINYYGPQNRAYIAYGTETPTPGYVLLNAGLGCSFTNKRGKTIVSLYALASNLLNTAYQDHLNRLKYFEFYSNNFTGHNGIYNMGRDISLKLNFPLDFKI